MHWFVDMAIVTGVIIPIVGGLSERKIAPVKFGWEVLTGEVGVLRHVCIARTRTGTQQGDACRVVVLYGRRWCADRGGEEGREGRPRRRGW